MKFKLLTILALTGMVFAGCNSDKKSGDQTDSSAVRTDSSVADTSAGVISTTDPGNTATSTGTGTTGGNGNGSTGTDGTVASGPATNANIDTAKKH